MRLRNATPTARAFAVALADAQAGTVSTDWGFTEPVNDALDRVARAAPFPPASLVDDARAAFAAEQAPDGATVTPAD